MHCRYTSHVFHYLFYLFRAEPEIVAFPKKLKWWYSNRIFSLELAVFEHKYGTRTCTLVSRFWHMTALVCQRLRAHHPLMSKPLLIPWFRTLRDSGFRAYTMAFGALHSLSAPIFGDTPQEWLTPDFWSTPNLVMYPHTDPVDRSVVHPRLRCLHIPARWNRRRMKEFTPFGIVNPLQLLVQVKGLPPAVTTKPCQKGKG